MIKIERLLARFVESVTVNARIIVRLYICTEINNINRCREILYRLKLFSIIMIFKRGKNSNASSYPRPVIAIYLPITKLQNRVK